MRFDRLPVAAIPAFGYVAVLGSSGIGEMGGASNRHVVLGLLMERPGYGYDLRQRIEDRLGFLGLSENAVYRILDRLEDDGWIVEVGERRVGRTRRGAARVMYGPTHEGADQFRRWVTQRSERADLRDEIRAKLLLTDPRDLPDLLAAVEEQAAECLAELAALKRPALATVSSSAVPWPHAAVILVDDFAIRWLQCLVDWLDDVCVVLEERILNDQGPEQRR